MHAAGHPYNLLSSHQVELLYHSALRILAEMGMEIQSQELLRLMAEAGWQADFQSERVRFPSAQVEDYLARQDKYDWEHPQPHVSASAGVYHSLYHDPLSGKLVPWTEEALAFYFALACHLPHVDGASMLGCRLLVPDGLEPLYERYYTWKYGANEGGSIYIDEICPYLLELCQARADDQGVSLSDVFHATVYLIPALKLGRHEAYQVAYFRDRGLQVGIGGSMFSMGANSPVTLAGTVALNLAENLALSLVRQALFGASRLYVHSSIAVLDMRTTIRPFGRPENAIANLMSAQLARHIGAWYGGHAALTDAKLPSVESGAQKALTGLPTLLAGGSLWVDAGLLAIDEVVSPIQLILDNEFISALQRFCIDFAVDEESIDLDTILEAGPGGQYLDKLHTARYFRTEHWNPGLWSRQMLTPWMEAGSMLDVDKARQFALDFQKGGLPTSGFSPAFEKEFQRIVGQARKSLEV